MEDKEVKAPECPVCGEPMTMTRWRDGRAKWRFGWECGCSVESRRDVVVIKEDS